ncbi:MAG: hypothetical protein IKE55_03135, partial [Kiritimatiellae bacterium]|nr:hypothetical protein [Kiritimatiellia bacterium]
MKATFRCLCMSPAIDATVTLPRAPKGDGEIFKDVSEVENVGGKTVNVARWLALRAREAGREAAAVACGGLLGEDNDRPFARELEKYGVEDCFLRVPGATRRNEMVTWPGGSVKLNRPAFPGLRGGGGLAERVLSRLSGGPADPPSAAVAVLSGSLPSAAGADFYAKAVAHFRSLGWRTVLDASGEAMRLGLEAGPDLVKPNAEECEPLVGFVPKTRDEFLKATAMLREKAAHAIISDGAAGAWFDGEFAPAPKVDVVDTTAAGDTLLAEFCWRFYA